MSSKVVEIDGSCGEGGGQIVRVALSLSCILKKAIKIKKIRANRPNAGLSNQHLCGLNLLRDITNARVHGNTAHSEEVEFDPQTIMSGHYTVDTHTAASITLLLQAVLPVLAFGERQSTLHLRGGTNVGMAPQVEFLTEVVRSNLELFGVTFDFDLKRRGYFPRGGGICNIEVPAIREIKPAQIESFGEVTEVVGWCFTAGRVPVHVAYDMKESVEKQLKENILPQPARNLYIQAYKESALMAPDDGAGLVIKASTSEMCTIGASALGEKRIFGSQLGMVAGRELCEYLRQKTCIDRYTQDQLIIYMALANGVSSIRTCRLTNHTLTAIKITELMTGVLFQTENTTEGHVILSCKGIGFINKNLIA